MYGDYLDPVSTDGLLPSRIFARRIRLARNAAHLRQEDWAALCGLSQSAISAWERGIGFSTLDTIAKCMVKAGMDPAILTGPDPAEGAQAVEEAALLAAYRLLTADERVFIRQMVELRAPRRSSV